MNYTIKEVRESVYLIEAENQYHLTSMFMRPQEFYESPFKNIRNKYFTMDEFMDTYANEKEKFSYLEDWEGFNIPSDKLKEFFITFKYDLSMKERLLFSLVDKICSNFKDDDFYIIGTYKKSKYKRTLSHELAHAYWKLYPEYKDNMSEYLSYISDDMMMNAFNMLQLYGYDESVFLDEIQAYIATEDKKTSIEIFNWKDTVKFPHKIKKYYNYFDKQQSI